MAIDQFATRKLLLTQKNIFPTRKFLRETFTEVGEAFNTEYVDIQYTKGQRKTAPYVNPLLPGKVIHRTGYTQKTYRPALVKPARPITQIDISRADFGENVYSEKTPAERARDLLTSDQAELDDYITRREEVITSELIFNGTVTQVGDGVNQVIDYDFENKVVLTTAQQWDKDGVNPFAQIAAWKKTVQQKSGINVINVVMDEYASAALISNPIVQELFDSRRYELGTIAPGEEVDGATYLGRITYPGANVNLWVYNEIYLEDWDLETGEQLETGVEKPMVPVGTIALLPAGKPFRWNYGAITVMDQVSGQFQTYASARVPQSWISVEPPARMLQINSRPILVPKNVDSWFVAKVVDAPTN